LTILIDFHVHAFCYTDLKQKDVAMNNLSNDKKMLIAIAVYAAVMTLIFHSLDADAEIKYPVKSLFVQTSDR
jgi:hypothetical protein